MRTGRLKTLKKKAAWTPRICFLTLRHRKTFARARTPQNQWSTRRSRTDPPAIPGTRRDNAVAVNGMRGARRSACPVRIALATSLGSDIDGAWWPRAGSVAAELPELVEALHRPLGEIVDIQVNWSTMERAPDLSSMTPYAMSIPGWRHGRQRLMMISGCRARAKLLVVPHLTSSALGLMVLRRAAAMRISDVQQVSMVFKTADCVVRTAEAESASWAGRMLDGETVATRVMQEALDERPLSDA